MPDGTIIARPRAAGADAFQIQGPAVVSFSGGRTSAYMLWRILEAHGGILPDGVVVCFANTGREMPATLDFVAQCASRWGVHVHWLEYRRDETTGRVWAEEVSHNSASREGEPFRALIQARRFLPNPVSRFCTTELKIRTIRRWCDGAFGRQVKLQQVVGLRADEPRRVERILDPARQKKAGRESRHVAVPLHQAGVTKADVMAFWQAQPFDLMLRGAWEGNCHGCMLKRRSFIVRLWQDHPELARQWADDEAFVARQTSGRGNRYRKDWKGGYAAIGQEASDMPRLPMLDPDDDGGDIFAACDTGCGV